MPKKNLFGFSGGTPNSQSSVSHGPEKVFLHTWGLQVFEMDNAKKHFSGSGVAPQTPIPPYTMGQKRCFWIPGMGVFGMDNAPKYCLGSGVAPQTPISLYIMGPKMCFWIPGMEVFGMRDANNY